MTLEGCRGHSGSKMSFVEEAQLLKLPHMSPHMNLSPYLSLCTHCPKGTKRGWKMRRTKKANSIEDEEDEESSTFYAKLGGYQLIIDGLRRFCIPYLV